MPGGQDGDSGSVQHSACPARCTTFTLAPLAMPGRHLVARGGGGLQVASAGHVTSTYALHEPPVIMIVHRRSGWVTTVGRGGLATTVGAGLVAGATPAVAVVATGGREAPGPAGGVAVVGGAEDGSTCDPVGRGGLVYVAGGAVVGGAGLGSASGPVGRGGLVGVADSAALGPAPR